MSSSQNQTPEEAGPAPAPAAAAPSDEASSSTSVQQPATDEDEVPRERHHHRRRVPSSEHVMFTASAAARRMDAANPLGIYPNARAAAAAAAAAAANASSATPAARNPCQPTARNRPPSSGGPVTAYYDSFADEYWYQVHDQVLRVQRASAPPPRRTTEERVTEARRAYTGLTNILHRLGSSSNSPEPK